MGAGNRRPQHSPVQHAWHFHIMQVFGCRHDLAGNVFAGNGLSNDLVIGWVLWCRSCRQLKTGTQLAIPTYGLVE